MDLTDDKLNLRGIADTLKISDGSLFTILHGNLSIRKLCLKWVLLLFTVYQKQQRVDDSERCLKPLQRNKENFFMWYMIMDET